VVIDGPLQIKAYMTNVRMDSERGSGLLASKDDKESTWKKSAFSIKDVSLVSPNTSIMDSIHSRIKPRPAQDSASLSGTFKLVNTFDHVSSESDGEDLDRQQLKYEEVLTKYEADIRQHISSEHQLQIYIDSLKNRVEELEDEAEKNEMIIGEARNEVMDLWAAKVEQNATLESLKESNADLALKVEAGNKLVERVESINEDLKQQIDILRSEVTRLTDDLLKTNSENKRLKQSNEQTQSQLGLANKQIQEKDRALEQVNGDNGRLREEKSSLQRALDEEKRKVERLRAAMEEMQRVQLQVKAS
jgi:chromosome segregation ATPase